MCARAVPREEHARRVDAIFIRMVYQVRNRLVHLQNLRGVPPVRSQHIVDVGDDIAVGREHPAIWRQLPLIPHQVIAPVRIDNQRLLAHALCGVEIHLAILKTAPI
ncbi:hypothetical protein SDC9_140146 [bioreactor metagenome]|uniref:Uncharacterized protein n=1 Tax=bioreactor metagenome TaxID=1076179 RepID=A0A645DU42_9ZZZZ